MRFRWVFIALGLAAATTLATATPRRRSVIAQTEVEPRRTAEAAVVRKTASATARVIAKLPANTIVTVVKETGDWIEIRAKVGRKQIAGFVAKSAVTAAPVTAATTPTEPEPVLVAPTSTEPRTTIEAVVVRKSPGEKEPVSGTLPAGTEVRVEGETGRWMKIRAGGVAGFVMRTQLTGPTPATDTTAFAPAGAAPAAEPELARTWAKRDPTRTTSDALSVFASRDATLRSDARPDASEVARVASGARLFVIDAADVAGFLRVRDEAGHEGYVAREHVGNGAMASALAAPTEQRAGARAQEARALPLPAPHSPARSFALRLDAGVGYRVLGMDFTSNGGGGFANYLASASAAAGGIELDATVRSTRRLVIGVDAQLAGSRSEIDYSGPTGPPGNVTFSTLTIDAGLRVGMRTRRLFEVSARAGAHYDVLTTSTVDNAVMLPRESLFGATLGARVDVIPPGSRVTATVRTDVLAIGRRRQTSGLEDGEDSTARAIWAGVTARFAFGRRYAVLGGYDFGRATTEWSGKSMRDPAATSARRVDSTQLVQVGISIGL